MNQKQPQPESDDGIDRRGFLKCMAWVGTGLVWTFNGGIPTSRVFGAIADEAEPKTGDFSFVQISDSHIGFAKEPNKDVVGTLRQAIARINALPKPPEFLLHTGDLTHLSKPEEFDTVAQVIKETKVERALYVPGEHDFFTDDGKQYLERYRTRDTRGLGWHSFDYRGVHFVGLVNVANLKPGGLGMLGEEQIDWLKKDLEGLADSTPLVAYAHVPLWAVYPKWGWGTEDSERALGLMRRFGAVTILNGHIHQVMQKVEGRVTFHTARSTAFPQPEPGKADSPGPIKNVPAEKLRSMLGLASLNYIERPGSLAIVDSTLE
ncbi:MAG TPA: metallophosphoesterase [Tepidisphaeraceae bacterium]|jgi:3',5'-cyclic AMP phosphodiesterase CpdA